MSDDVFNAEDATDNVTVTCGNTSKTFESPVEVSTVQQFAREQGVKKFQVEDASDGDKVTSDDFPYSGDMKVVEYNENA